MRGNHSFYNYFQFIPTVESKNDEQPLKNDDKQNQDRVKGSNKKNANSTNNQTDAQTSETKEDKPAATTTKPALGEVGYEFRKEFNTGWYTGKVVEIRPLAGKKSYTFSMLIHVHIMSNDIPIILYRKWIRP